LTDATLLAQIAKTHKKLDIREIAAARVSDAQLRSLLSESIRAERETREKGEREEEARRLSFDLFCPKCQKTVRASDAAEHRELRRYGEENNYQIFFLCNDCRAQLWNRPNGHPWERWETSQGSHGD
jgi:uncharacterized protein with PIN domain